MKKRKIILFLAFVLFLPSYQALASGTGTPISAPEQTITMSMSQWTEWKNQLTGLRTECSQQEIELETLRNKFSLLDQNSTAQLAAIDRIENRLLITRKKLQNAEKSLTAAKSEIEACRKELSECRELVEMLKEQIQELEHKNAVIRRQRDFLGGIVGVIAGSKIYKEVTD